MLFYILIYLFIGRQVSIRVKKIRTIKNTKSNGSTNKNLVPEPQNKMEEANGSSFKACPSAGTFSFRIAGNAPFTWSTKFSNEHSYTPSNFSLSTKSKSKSQQCPFSVVISSFGFIKYNRNNKLNQLQVITIKLQIK